MIHAFLQNLSTAFEDRQNRFLRDFWHAQPNSKNDKPVRATLRHAIYGAVVAGGFSGAIGAIAFGMPAFWTAAASFIASYATTVATCITRICRAKPDNFLFFRSSWAVEGDKKDLLLVHRTKDVVNDISHAAFAEISSGQEGVPQAERDKLNKRLSFYFNDVKDAARRIRVKNDKNEYVDDFDLGAGTAVGEHFPVVLTRLQTRDGFEKEEAVKTAAAKEKVIAEAGTTQTDIDMPEGFVVSDKKRVALKI